MNTENTALTHKAPTKGDPRYNFAHVVAVTGKLIQETNPDQMTNTTPCTDFDVEMLTGHLVAVLARVSAVARGEDPFSVPHVATKQAGQSWYEAWTAEAHQVQIDWSDPEVLDRPLTLPFGVLPGAMAITAYCSEISVHAWDLAKATGRTADFDDALLADALASSKFGVPEEGRGEDLPFDPVVEISANAPVVDQIAAWLGHKAAQS